MSYRSKTKRKERIISPAKPGEPASRLYVDSEGSYRIKKTSDKVARTILMRPATRKFNGRLYTRESAHSSKASAQRKAEAIRAKGNAQARVVKMKINTATATRGRVKQKDAYGVYVRSSKR